jgi:sialate O-acetylesterase
MNNLAVLAALVSPVLVFADVTLPGVFSDNMVLQRDLEIAIFGKAEAGEEVTASVAGQKASAKAGADGKFVIKVPPLKAGGPHELTVAGKNTITIKNVMVGEVWLASGQSNMAFTLSKSADAADAIAQADQSQLRLLTITRGTAETPQSIHGGRWEVCSAKNAGSFSAVAYHFGLELQKKLNCPVGLINASWAGTPIEPWMSKAALESDPAFKEILDGWAAKIAGGKAANDAYEPQYQEWRKNAEQSIASKSRFGQQPDAPETSPRHHYSPNSTRNFMIEPLAPFTIRGVIWYQGEGNRDRPDLYRTLFPLMIQDWRTLWGSEFTFLFVQLPNYGKPSDVPTDTKMAQQREAQALALSLPKTGMAVTIDIGNPADIHPTNKKDVGYRLAQQALAVAYEQKVVPSGPLFESMKIEGDKARIAFKHADGLEAKGGEPLKGFAIAGADNKFVWADAKIDGATVVVSSPQVKQPAAVRYAWADVPTANLFNKAGLPAAPFRTDAPK